MPQNKNFVWVPAWAIIVSFIVLLLIISSLIITVFPPTVWNPPQKVKTFGAYLNNVLPQGWGFFTKSSADPALTVYSKDGQEVLEWPASSAANLFGFSRDGRSQGLEVGLIASQIEENEWINCRSENIHDCILQVKIEQNPVLELENYGTRTTLCGRMVFLEMGPVEYLYRDLYDMREIPERAISINVSCDQE